MRRLVTISWFMACSLLAPGVPAVGQLFQPARNATPAAAPTLNHFSGVKAAPPPGPGFGTRDVPTTLRPQPPAAPPAQQFPAHDAAPRASRDWDSRHEQRRPHHHHRWRGSNLWWGWGASYPWIGSPFYTSAFGPTYPGVAFLPSGALISGPLVSDPLLDPAIAPSPVVAPEVVAPMPEPGPPGQPKATNPEQKAKAGKFITFGDTNFANQKYLAALGRYKTAAQVAPDLGEPYFRQGHAHVALGQYESAIKAFRRGLRIEGDWTAVPLRLDQLYQGNRAAKTSHLENLAKAVEANPFDTDLLTLLGLQLFFDGQRERSLPFFERAAQLGGNEDRLLDDFMPQPVPAGEPQPPLKPAAQPGPAKIVF